MVPGFPFSLYRFNVGRGFCVSILTSWMRLLCSVESNNVLKCLMLCVQKAQYFVFKQVLVSIIPILFFRLHCDIYKLWFLPREYVLVFQSPWQQLSLDNSLIWETETACHSTNCPSTSKGNWRPHEGNRKREDSTEKADKNLQELGSKKKMGKTASSRAHIREETRVQEEDENSSVVSAAREALGGSAETNNEVTLISGKTCGSNQHQRTTHSACPLNKRSNKWSSCNEILSIIRQNISTHTYNVSTCFISKSLVVGVLKIWSNFEHFHNKTIFEIFWFLLWDFM